MANYTTVSYFGKRNWTQLTALSGGPFFKFLKRAQWSSVTNGTYKVAGTAMLNGSPIAGKIHLFNNVGMANIIAEQDTGSNGLFEFTRLAPGKYLVVGIDRTDANNGGIAQSITAVPM